MLVPSQDAPADRASRLCTWAAHGEPAGLSLHSLCSWVARVPWDLTAQVTPLPTPGLPPSPVLITALPKVMPSVVDVNCSAASPAKGGGARTGSISAHAGQRPAPAGTRAPAPLDPAWRQICLGEREGLRWQVKRDHPGGSNGTGWRAAYSEIRECNKSASSHHTPSPSASRVLWHRNVPAGAARGCSVVLENGQPQTRHTEQ